MSETVGTAVISIRLTVEDMAVLATKRTDTARWDYIRKLIEAELPQAEWDLPVEF